MQLQHSPKYVINHELVFQPLYLQSFDICFLQSSIVFNVAKRVCHATLGRVATLIVWCDKSKRSISAGLARWTFDGFGGATFNYIKVKYVYLHILAFIKVKEYEVVPLKLGALGVPPFAIKEVFKSRLVLGAITLCGLSWMVPCSIESCNKLNIRHTLLQWVVVHDKIHECVVWTCVPADFLISSMGEPCSNGVKH